MKCVLRLSGVVYGPIYDRFIGCTVNGFLSWGLQRSGPTDPPIHFVKKDQDNNLPHGKFHRFLFPFSSIF